MPNKIQLGKAFVLIGGDASPLGKVLKGVRESVFKTFDAIDKAGRKLIKVGALIEAPLAAAAFQFARLGDEVAKGAKRTGLSTEAYSELAHVATLAGANMGALDKSLIKMSKTIFDARLGLTTATDALGAIGLRLRDIEGLSPEAQFTKIADAIGKVDDQATKAGAAMGIFGRGGKELLPIFQLGAEGIRHYREEAQRLGVTIGPGMAGTAEVLTDMMARMKAAFDSLTRTVGFQVAPTFIKVAKVLTNLTVNFREFLENNPKIVKSMQQLAAALLAVGASMVAIGTAGKALSILISPGGILLGLAATFLVVSGALDGLIDKWKDTVLAFQVGGKSIAQWGEQLKRIFVSIRPALEATFVFIGQAFSLLWESIKLGWFKTLRSITVSIAQLFGKLHLALFKAAKESSSPVAREVLGSLSQAAGAIPGAVLDGGASKTRIEEQRKSVAKLQMDAVVGAGIMQSSWQNALDGVGKTLTENAGDITEAIFGKKSGPVNSLGDLFKGIFTDFKEFQIPALAKAGGAGGIASRPAFLGAGTFSGREARGLFEGSQAQDTQSAQLRALETLVKQGKTKSGANFQ